MGVSGLITLMIGTEKVGKSMVLCPWKHTIAWKNLLKDVRLHTQKKKKMRQEFFVWLNSLESIEENMSLEAESLILFTDK